MAKNTQKQGFPLRLRPNLIKELRDEAKTIPVPVGNYVEGILENRANERA